MGCKAPRKRSSRRLIRTTRDAREEADPDWDELAAVLAESKLDAGPAGWFTAPWRDGWNAVQLARDLAELENDGWADYERAVDTFLRVHVATRANDASTYYEAEEYLRGSACYFQSAALRCLQLVISKSHGGGDVYNVVLRIAFDREKTLPSPERAADLVMEHRGYDTLDTTLMMQGEKYDRVRRAFQTAWNRGLYAVAAALPAITSQGAKA
jgi:hypothetical protein